MKERNVTSVWLALKKTSRVYTCPIFEERKEWKQLLRWTDGKGEPLGTLDWTSASVQLKHCNYFCLYIYVRPKVSVVIRDYDCAVQIHALCEFSESLFQFTKFLFIQKFIFLSAHNGNKSYGKTSSPISFSEAADYCGAAGGRFARLSHEEDFSLLTETDFPKPIDLWIPVKKQETFISFQDRVCDSPFRSSERISMFEWVDKKDWPVKLSSNAKLSLGSCEELCMIVGRYGSSYRRLDDYNCTYALPALCESRSKFVWGTSKEKVRGKGRKFRS